MSSTTRRRRTAALDFDQAQSIVAAASFAPALGYPLNRFTTVHFEAAGIVDPPAAIKRLRKLASDYLALRGIPLVDVWVRETGPGKGEHWHWLLHAPPGLRLGDRQPGWLRLCGAARNRGRQSGVIHSRAVGRSLSHALVGRRYGELYSDHLAAVVGYLLKGASPAVRSALAIDRAEPGGAITGKRCGTSANIGAAARKRAGFIAPLGLADLAERLAPGAGTTAVNTAGEQEAGTVHGGWWESALASAGHRPARRVSARANKIRGNIGLPGGVPNPYAHRRDTNPTAERER